jgi:hypothetical protein
MAYAIDPPTWPAPRQRALIAALGSSDPVLLRDLAVVWQRAALRATFLPRERAEDARVQAVFEADVRRLRTAAGALATAAAALQGLLTPFFRGAVDDGLGPNWRAEIARWQACVEQDARWRGNPRRRGKPHTERRYLAQDVADVLAWHGIPPTSGPSGRFARVLDLMCVALGIDGGDIEGLVKAVVQARR